MSKRLFSDPRYHLLVEALLKASKGIFSYRIPISDSKDEIDTLALIFNNASLQLARMFRELQVTSPKFLQPKIFILIDKNHAINSYFDSAGLIIKNADPAVSLLQLLSDRSKKKYKRRFTLFLNSKDQEFDIGVIDFVSPEGLLIPLKARIYCPGRYTRLDLFLLIGYDPEDAIYMTKTKARSSPSPLALKVINSDSKNIYDYQLSEKLHRILMEGLHDGIPSLGDIAFKAAASVSRIKRVFKERFHQSILQYDMEKRLEGSLTILEGGGMSIKQVSHHFGFKTPAHFTQRFKRHFGVTPSQYRKNYFSKISERNLG